MPIYKNVKIIGYSDLIAVSPLNIYIWLIPLCLYNVFFFLCPYTCQHRNQMGKRSMKIKFILFFPIVSENEKMPSFYSYINIKCEIKRCNWIFILSY